MAKNVIFYTEEQEHYIKQMILQHGKSWTLISQLYNSQFGTEKTADAIRKLYTNSLQFKLTQIDQLSLESLETKLAVKKTLSNQKKLVESALNKNIKNQTLQEIVQQSNEELKKYLKDNNINQVIKTNSIKIKNNNISKKPNIAIFLMISDTHNGKLVYTYDVKTNQKVVLFDEEVFKARTTRVSDVFKDYCLRLSKDYNLDKVYFLFMGDLIENSEMHGRESLLNCEYGNSMQVSNSIIDFLDLLLVPITTFIRTVNPKVKFLSKCITGNHDRLTEGKTYSSPGLDDLSYIIYKQLEYSSNLLGLKIDWEISQHKHLLFNCYGVNILLEHGDEVKALSVVALQARKKKLEDFYGVKIDMFLIGHFHSFLQIGCEILVNLSLCGQDSYAENLGFKSRAGQVAFSLIETLRNYKLYDVFIIDVEDITKQSIKKKGK